MRRREFKNAARRVLSRGRILKICDTQSRRPATAASKRINAAIQRVAGQACGISLHRRKPIG
jgi:hypothetical protein